MNFTVAKHLITFRNNLVLFSLGCYGLGFSYLAIYYNSFNLPIIYYLSLNDLLLFALSIILPVIVIIILFEILILPFAITFFEKIHGKPIKAEIASLILSNLIFYTFLSIYIIFKDISINPTLHFFTIFTCIVLISRTIVYKNPKYLIVSLIIFSIGFLIGINAIINTAKNGSANLEVKFNYKGKIINTRYYSDNLYVGETSSCIFLYDLKTEKSSVFEKSNITDLAYLDKIKNSDWYTKPIKLPEFKSVGANDTLSSKNSWNHFQNPFVYKIEIDQTPDGISRTLRTLDWVLETNKFDPEIPYVDYTYLPSDLDRKDFKKLNDAILTGDYRIKQYWLHSSGIINLEMSKKHYMIRIEFNDTINQKNSHNRL